MFTIKKDITYEYIVNKSKFIAKIFYVNSEQEVTNIIKSIKDEYKDASHICFGYIINNIKRFNDDGEPSGTAGTPILNVLEKKNLNMVLAIVIRYFGGIKLGAGGLIRAYSTAVSNAINNVEIGTIVKGKKINLVCTYEELKQVEFILKEAVIINKNFNDKVSINFIICDDDYNKIKITLNKYSNTMEENNIDLVK